MCNFTETETVTESTTRNMACALVFGSVMTLGLPLNAVALWILVRRHSLQSPSAVFMVNLAISDLLLVISLPMRVYFFATGTWALGPMACIWFTMLFRNNIRSSSIFITFICMDRLLAVVFPLRSRHLRTSSNAWKAAALVWLCVVVVNIPESINFSKRLQNLTESGCNATCFKLPDDSSDHSSLIQYFQPVLVFTMLTINVVCTALVFWTLSKRLSDSAKVNNKVNVMLIFVLNLLMFTVFFFPLSLSVLIDWQQAIIPLTCLASVNCCLDPLLYYFSFDGFWKKKEDVDNHARDYSMITIDRNRGH
ncbi:lysophosphatidic acid receptor 6-like [Dicentrarchus labrax]|uniref:G-protein coupled receptors family 1 profile domain-containing protein n=1 Tax=Dicentrarchus labrax TaxID=13489 RepID=A0A8P4G672_DICLA|nr:lysophosphatidic acid receptor 6-like [Dicentrarchus labrax]